MDKSLQGCIVFRYNNNKYSLDFIYKLLSSHILSIIIHSYDTNNMNTIIQFIALLLEHLPLIQVL
ncbi:unnamed protein product [Paramecium sonneborni]|uniref:Uncharacterized protein n=1 Tax=Paramecium sonneborni TaxID=65129 RepID=A0A8S1M5M8_9CILI|nr:unnamed protein product [Paramecium sonneborni]